MAAKRRRSGPRGLAEPRTIKEKQAFKIMDMLNLGSKADSARTFEELMAILKVPSPRRPGLVARWLYDHRGGWDAAR